MKRIALITLIMMTSLSAQACEQASVAIRYLSAIDDMDWQTMSSLLGEKAHYTDPTMTYYDRPAIDLKGRDEIVEFWRSSSEDSGTSDIGYTVSACFETGGYHMVNLDIAIRVSGEFWNVDKDEIVITGKVISVIRVEDEVVTEHHDFVGYRGADSVVSDLQERHGKITQDQ